MSCLDSAGRVETVGDAAADAEANPTAGAFIVRGPRSAILACSGTMVAPRVVLTAAHCVTHGPVDRLEFTLSGDPTSAPKAASAPVRRIFVNPQYDLRAKGSLHDIALVELGAPLGAPVCERLLTPKSAEMLRPGASIELVGYGDPKVAGQSGFGRKTVTWARITSVRTDEMTIGGPGEPQSCEGDSGGPAFVVDASGTRWLAAIASRSANDATRCVDGSIHTRVDSYAGWLAATIARIGEGAERSASL